ncbi:MAG TPA: hypothetical protein VGP07_10495 [Polyangia bacterium]|jgi:hypothetical protein
MSTVGSLGSGGDGGFSTQTTSVTAATALTMLRRNPTSAVTISDTAQNILKNLDALQKVASKITSLSASDSNKNMTVSATQFSGDRAVMNLWGAGSGQTVAVTGVKAANVSTFPSYVTSMTVSDSSANIQNNLDRLQTAATAGTVTEIAQVGPAANLSITTSQLTADSTALGLIKNHAYTLAITNATVSDVLGQGSAPALAANAKIKSIAITDTTDNIHSNLDALQKVGLRIKSIAQTDAATPMTITGNQYNNDKLVLGKFITADHLAVLDASASQTRLLHADAKVVSVAVNDTAANLSKNWALLQSLTSSLTSVNVSNSSAAIGVTAAQLADSTTLLGKFTDDSSHTYHLAVSGVTAANAATMATTDHVDNVAISDSAANVVANMADLQSVNAAGKLKSITVGTTLATMSMTMDVSALQGSQQAATQGVLDKITHAAYHLAITGAAASDLTDLAANRRVAAITVSDTSANISSSLNTLYHLGGRLTSIEQTDAGTAFALTQGQFDSRSGVLAKISGGYTANLTGVTAAKATADAKNVHVGAMDVSDTGRNIIAHWTDLRALGTNLSSISKSDDGALSLTATNYQLGVHDDLVSKFDSSTNFAVNGATVAQAQSIAGDSQVTQIDVVDAGSTVVANMSGLSDLLTAGKLNSITNSTPGESLAMDAGALSDAQPVLDLIKGGNYTLALSGVDAGDAHDLATSNHKIVSLAVTGDSTSIAANLAALNGLGRKLVDLTQTDAGTDLALTGAAFGANMDALGKIAGGFTAVLSDVSAAQAGAFADNASVTSLAVSDTAAHLASAWQSMSSIGDKLNGVTQSDTGNLQLNVDDWNDGQDLRAKFDSDPTVSLSGVSVSQVDDLASDSAVQAIQLSDSSAAISDALSDLAGQSKINQIVLDDPTAALTLSAHDYQASSALLGTIKNHQYTVALDTVTAADAATLASDAHVASMDVTDTGANISSHFDALAAATNVSSITLSDQDGTLTLTSSQILDNASTLGEISNSYNLAATGVAVADLSSFQNIPQISTISLGDTADNISSNFSDVVAMGDTLGSIHLTDSSPVLALSAQDYAAGADALAKIDAPYQVDVSDARSADAQTIGADSSVRQMTVTDSASNVSSQWDNLVSLYSGGAGKLTALSLTDGGSLTLTADQQTAGAALLADLLPDANVVTA